MIKIYNDLSFKAEIKTLVNGSIPINELIFLLKKQQEINCDEVFFIEEKDKCIWSITPDDDFYFLSCGEQFVLNEHEIAVDEFPFKFCPYCGAEAAEVVLGADDE